MKKKIFAALTVMFALSLALTVYAINQTAPVSVKSAADCCAKKDSCPMKNKEAKAEKSSCCDKADCCCKGDSCPMRANGDEKTLAEKECCKKGGVCPMKSEKQTASADVKSETVAANSLDR